jgi:hypothetical protein
MTWEEDQTAREQDGEVIREGDPELGHQGQVSWEKYMFVFTRNHLMGGMTSWIKRKFILKNQGISQNPQMRSALKGGLGW